MAANRSPSLAIDLSRVVGGDDKQTRAARLVIDVAVASIRGIAARLTREDPFLKLAAEIIPMLERRGPRSGPTPAPALPPATTLAG